MPPWINRLLDQSDPTLAAHIAVGCVLVVPFLVMTVVHGIWPQIAWDPQGYGIGSGGITAAIGLGNWGGPKKP